MEKEKIALEIIALEKSALEKWNQGNPSGYLEIYSKDITYFDPFQQIRLDGFDSLEKLYESLRGTVHVDRYEMLNPEVEVSPEMAVLSYNLISYSGKEIYKWNCSEVYQKEEDGVWRIIHNHWSFINPLNNG
jgi:ketosteroid isomerase-like protein